MSSLGAIVLRVCFLRSLLRFFVFFFISFVGVGIYQRLCVVTLVCLTINTRHFINKSMIFDITLYNIHYVPVTRFDFLLFFVVFFINFVCHKSFYIEAHVKQWINSEKLKRKVDEKNNRLREIEIENEQKSSYNNSSCRENISIFLKCSLKMQMLKTCRVSLIIKEKKQKGRVALRVCYTRVLF